MDVSRQRAHVFKFYQTRIETFFSTAIEIVILKGDDYAPERVAMTEVFFTAAEIGVTAPQILWVHVRKHMSAIASYLQRGNLKSEDIRSRLADVANYMALIDSYIADPWAWLDHLADMIQLSEFPHRTSEEVTALRLWVSSQRLALGDRPLPVCR